MLKKFILLLISITLLSHCGFTPIHSNKINKNFSIEALSFTGDKTINNYIKVNLKQFENNNSEKKFKLKINTKYKKDTLAKDKTAKITNFKLSSVSTIQINFNGNDIKEINISQNKNMDNYDDKFEERKNERNIKQNFASAITRQIITEISILNDN